jgi:hypothetical protein
MTLPGRLDLRGRRLLKTAAEAWPKHTLVELLQLSGALTKAKSLAPVPGKAR